MPEMPVIFMLLDQNILHGDRKREAEQLLRKSCIEGLGRGVYVETFSTLVTLFNALISVRNRILNPFAVVFADTHDQDQMLRYLRMVRRDLSCTVSVSSREERLRMILPLWDNDQGFMLNEQSRWVSSGAKIALQKMAHLLGFEKPEESFAL